MRVNAARAGTCRWHVSTQQFTRGEISEQKPDQEGMMNAGDASLQASAPIIEDGEPADVKKQSLPPQLYHMNQAKSSNSFPKPHFYAAQFRPHCSREVQYNRAYKDIVNSRFSSAEKIIYAVSCFLRLFYVPPRTTPPPHHPTSPSFPLDPFASIGYIQ